MLGRVRPTILELAIEADKSIPDGVNVWGLARERAMYVRSHQHEKVMMVDAELARVGYTADDEGTPRKLPPVERADRTLPEAAVETAAPKRRPARERAVDPAPETVVDRD